MEFDKSRVFTAVNADELKVGSKAIVADNLTELKVSILTHRLPKVIESIESEHSSARFLCDDGFHYSLAYLVEEPEEKGLKVADLKIGDIVRHKSGNLEYLVTGIDHNENEVFFCDAWSDDEELGNWEKVEK